MHNYFSKIIIHLFAIFLFSSCDLLTTRDAEDPEFGRSSFVIATTPDQLFTNLRNSFSEKIEKDYMSCFADTSFIDIPYHFIPSSEATFNYPILNEWTIDDEELYFRSLINAVEESSAIILSLEFISNSVEGNVENRTYNYTISLPVINESTSQIYEGNAFFRIHLDQNNQWVITEWRDTRTSDNPSWSDLKGLFYLF